MIPNFIKLSIYTLTIGLTFVGALVILLKLFINI